jgi:hypothetical protein
MTVIHGKRLSIRLRQKDYTDEQWTKKLIEFLWTHSNTLWKDRCAAAHALEKPAQLRVELAYAHSSLMLPTIGVSLAYYWKNEYNHELLNSWRGLTMLRLINQSVRDAQAQLRTGHRDIRGFLSRATAVTTDHTATIPIDTSSARLIAPTQDTRQHLQNARTQMATISSDIR